MKCEHPDQSNYIGCGRCPVSSKCEIRKRRLDTPPNPQPSEPEKVKPLAQYLGEYVDHELTELSHNAVKWWQQLFQQALDAYESTEQVKIRIERV